MDESQMRQEIEEFAVKEFSSLLLQHGFSSPQLTRENHATRIDFLFEDIAIEVELDWRDFAAFLLIVQLENGSLPNGYYVSNGKPSRKHISEVIREQHWHTTEGPRLDQRIPKYSNAPDMKAALQMYKEQLAGCIAELLYSRDTLFSVQKSNVMEGHFGKAVEAASKLKLSVRVELRDGTLLEWSPWVTTPANGYLELATGGPYKQAEVAAIDIDPIRSEKVGLLVPDKKTDLSNELVSYLSSHNIAYEIMEGYFRIRI
jgi:hypothetical protein